MTWAKIISIAAIILVLNKDVEAWGRRRRSCDSTPCSWKWSGCSKTCGGGTQYPIKTSNQGSCGSCNMPSGTRACNTQCCRLDCTWNMWGNWQECSITCGGGDQTRIRSKHGPSCGGTDCSGPSTEDRQCNAHCCPVDCEWTEWSTVGDCSTTCGGGFQERDRVLMTLSSCGGAPCNGTTRDEIPCNTQCCPVDCVWAIWESWSTCSKTCGTGTQYRERDEAIVEYCGGSPCQDSNWENQICNTQCCLYDCVWGEWGEWSDCTKTCGDGEMARNRNVSQLAECGGADCVGDVCETTPCSEFCCPDDCYFGPWTTWTECDAACGGGSQNRSRTLSINPACNSQICQDPLDQDRSCNTQCCPVDCRLSDWSPWSTCTATCGNTGTQHRDRYIEQEVQCGGANCTGAFEQTQDCNRLCFNEGSVMTNDGCVCGAGWQGECCEIDINECDTVTCPEHSDCINSDGSFECACHYNYTKEGDICIHFDKCKTGRHDCSHHAECMMIDRENYTCECNPGYTGSGYICVDIDECLIDEEPEDESSGSGEYSGVETITEWYPICNPDGSCINTDGSYYCVCNTGFIGDGFVNCTDVDECEFQQAMLDSPAGSYNSSDLYCSPYAVCNNSIGSYICTCKAGYYGNGKTCSEIDECASDPCQNGGGCVDLINGFQCQCDGYEGPLCGIDIDECETGTDDCDTQFGNCFNTDGSYICECKGGFEGDGVECIESKTDVCLSTEDSPSCANGSSANVLSSLDINECETETHACADQFPICVNLPGSYACECEPGATDGPPDAKSVG